jgi:SAM-dependent methyltransferase
LTQERKLPGLEPVWDASYGLQQNFLFYPNEEIIRFISKFIVKRTGLNSHEGVGPNWQQSRSLDIGCGIGRHMIYLKENDLNVWGVDISSVAIEFARNWWVERGYTNPEKYILKSSASMMPFEEHFFDYALSHGTLDSMTLHEAKLTVSEIHRVIKKDGLFYLDLIGNDDSSVKKGFEGEVVIQEEHEKGTIQSYFSILKIEDLVANLFEIVDCTLVKHLDLKNSNYHSRYHLVLRALW